MDGEIHGSLKNREKSIVLDNIGTMLFGNSIVSDIIGPRKGIGSFIEK